MKYTEAERMNIGRRIYEDEITQNEAAEEYCITPTTARNYMRLYRDTCQLPAKKQRRNSYYHYKASCAPSRDKYEAMTKDELISELVMARINEARLKKGYEVKGVGQSKEFLPIDSENTK